MHKISPVLVGLESREREPVIESLTQGNASNVWRRAFGQPYCAVFQMNGPP
jgi:hypothetical protein